MFTTIFYQPVLNLLIFFYNIIPGHDIALAIIGLTILTKAILWPLSAKSIKSQKSLQTLQPKIDALKAKYPKPEDREQMTKEMMAMYKEEKINPFSSCLPLLVQLPFFWAIFRVFRDELTGKASGLVYPFVYNPGPLNPLAFGLLDFSKPNIVLAILAGIAQFVQAKMLMSKKPAVQGEASKDESMAAIMNKQMTYIFPVMTVFICLTMPSGLSFYWFLTTVVTILQQALTFKKKDDDNFQTKVIEGKVIN